MERVCLPSLKSTRPEDQHGGPHHQVYMQRVKVLADKSAMEQPKYTVMAKECLVTWVKVNRYEAWMLWDLGSTTLGLTPLFAHVVGIKVAPLAVPITLQLGMIESCSMVNYGTRVIINVPQEY